MPLMRWLPTFLAFPLGGLLAFETVGSVEGPATAAAAGLLAGAAIGAGQWLALRGRGIHPRWIAATALAMAGSSAIAAGLTGAGTQVQDLVLTGALVGVTVGGAQALSAGRGRLPAIAWTALTGATWSLGWLVTWSAGIDVDRGFVVFGASGAVVATLVTGMVLRRLLSDPGADISVASAPALGAGA